MLSNSRWTSCFLRVAPVDSRQQITQLCRRDRHCFTRNRWPDEPSSLKFFGKQACSLAIVPNDLQKIAAFAPEAEKTAAHGVALEHFLHAQSQARKATPHVRMARRQQHSHARPDRDQRNVSSPRMIRSKNARSTLWSHDHASAIRCHDLQSVHRHRRGRLCRRLDLRHNLGWHKSIGLTVAKLSFATGLAPRKQKLLRKPITPCGRRHQPGPRKTFLDNSKLLGIQPASTPASLHDFKAAHLTTISKDIHTDSQL